ncbi:MAG: tRNA (guanosine(46)-N7)-methyltransferase TrmB [Ruminococcus sp.]|nr:tRNA (guanosine(46)-N7)-methyltransferase TrmB [Ruminococcus sp.]
MRLRNIKDKDNYLDTCLYLIKDYKSYKGNWNKEFKNDKPIHLEIGMGKGDFIYQMAINNPDINFIGIEKYSNVLARAIKKYPDKLDNLRIINLDALNLCDVFDKEIETIYLNFSDPWPKKRQAKRRLTSEVFLNIYDSIFKDVKRIIMKTDNLGLFASSIVSLSNYGYRFIDVNLDLTNSDIPNVLTEYEAKFINDNIKINYLVAEKE